MYITIRHLNKKNAYFQHKQHNVKRFIEVSVKIKVVVWGEQLNLT